MVIMTKTQNRRIEILEFSVSFLSLVDLVQFNQVRLSTKSTVKVFFFCSLYQYSCSEMYSFIVQSFMTKWWISELWMFVIKCICYVSVCLKLWISFKFSFIPSSFKYIYFFKFTIILLVCNCSYFLFIYFLFIVLSTLISGFREISLSQINRIPFVVWCSLILWFCLSRWFVFCCYIYWSVSLNPLISCLF